MKCLIYRYIRHSCFISMGCFLVLLLQCFHEIFLQNLVASVPFTHGNKKNYCLYGNLLWYNIDFLHFREADLNFYRLSSDSDCKVWVWLVYAYMFSCTKLPYIKHVKFIYNKNYQIPSNEFQNTWVYTAMNFVLGRDEWGGNAR